ncbi:guanitoxin biosynthesis heme-dependent pre-guanitoxin N-hydroxylase GntA [Deinococcus multiflagellatus]|uniref:Guanitoxin biosynthesis heme-dependent pre-guanitoxin N-hydroxylase GntA n=1 Tax=Deinococcus multiflagellatus TaxID=1656887 RepID=A0ABW1ZKE9_9DEIO|nr:guanitoxin biosynthesis heme-dependent pre-guanitoxin N-hydroxylase GntA [Deinococcus multiflagellatus]MBZ9714820.1 YqcI/YcgG family protein [Deinococcus multiflagellatus]
MTQYISQRPARLPTIAPSSASSYHLICSGEPQATGGPVTAEVQARHGALREAILAPTFSCVAARASLNTSCYALGCYGALSDEASVQALAQDLARFVLDQDRMDSDFTSLIATFGGEAPASEEAFEAQLWALLRALHRLDTAPYSPEVSADPQDPRFGFSFGGRAFFIIGLHPRSSRLARTLPFPALVFNAHRQFQALRDSGRFPRMQQTIRARELKLQGNLNPNLANHGEVTEARQYSGRAVEADWAAPFPHEPQAPKGRCPFGHS